MNRRGFLGSILALGVAPAIVRADSLMRIYKPRTLGPTTFDLRIGTYSVPVVIDEQCPSDTIYFINRVLVASRVKLVVERSFEFDAMVRRLEMARA